MQSTENWLTQAFLDVPIRQADLEGMQDNIMAQILKAPVDFADERMLAKRRRWGLLFAGSWLGLGLIVLVLIVVFFNHQVIFAGLQLFFSLVTQLKLLLALKDPLLMLWQEYSWQLTGMVVILASLGRGLWVNPTLAQPGKTE